MNNIELLPSNLLGQICLYLNTNETYNNVCILSKYWRNFINPIINTECHELDNKRILYSIELVLSLTNYNNSHIITFLKDWRIFALQTNFVHLNALHLQNIPELALIFINNINFPNLEILSLYMVEIHANNFLSTRPLKLPQKLLNLRIEYCDINALIRACEIPKSLEILFLRGYDSAEYSINQMTLLNLIESLHSLKSIEFLSCHIKKELSYFDYNYTLPHKLEKLYLRCAHDDSYKIFFYNAILPNSLKILNLDTGGLDVDLNKISKLPNLTEINLIACKFYSNGELYSELFDFPEFVSFELKQIYINCRRCTENQICKNFKVPSSVEKFICENLKIKKLFLYKDYIQELSITNSIIEEISDFEGNILHLNKCSKLENLTLSFKNENILTKSRLPPSITSIKLSFPELTNVFCSDHTERDYIYNVSAKSISYFIVPNFLKDLKCNGPNLLTVDLRIAKSLHTLDLSNCPLINFDQVYIPDNISKLNIDSCNLSNLPILPSCLCSLSCYKNNIKEFPIFNDKIGYLIIMGNPATELPNLPLALRMFGTDIPPTFSLFIKYKQLPPNMSFWCMEGMLEDSSKFKLINTILVHLCELRDCINQSKDLRIAYNNLLLCLSNIKAKYGSNILKMLAHLKLIEFLESLKKEGLTEDFVANLHLLLDN